MVEQGEPTRENSKANQTQFEELGPKFVTRYEVSVKELEDQLKRENYQHDSAFVVAMINNNCFLNDEDLVRFVPIFRQEFNYGSLGQGELMAYLKRLSSKVCLKSLVLKEICCRAILTYNCIATLDEQGENPKHRSSLQEKLDKSLKPIAKKTNRFSRIDKAFLFKARALRRVLERQERISSASNRQTLIDRTEELAGLTKNKKHDFLRRSRKTRLVARPPEWYVRKRRQQKARGLRPRRSLAMFVPSPSKTDMLAKTIAEPKRTMCSPEALKAFQDEDTARENRAVARDLKRAEENPFAFSDKHWIRGLQSCPTVQGRQGPASVSTKCRKHSIGPRAVRFRSKVTSSKPRRPKASSDCDLTRTLKSNQLREAEEAKQQALKKKVEEAVNARMNRFVNMLHHSCNSDLRTFKLV